MPRTVSSSPSPRGSSTLDEAVNLMDAAADDKWSCMWLLILALGVRRGEALGLRWADIDFDNRTGTAREQVLWQRGEPDPQIGRRTGRLVAKKPKSRKPAPCQPRQACSTN